MDLKQTSSPDSPEPQPPQPASDGAAIEQARRLVCGPAIGLLIVGMLNCLTIPAIVFVAIPAGGRMGPAPASPPAGPTILEILGAVVAICVFIFVTVLPGAFMILAAVKMRWLQAYWLAVVASVMAILTSPAGFCLGLPIGIWSLVVLSQRNARAAFGAVADALGTPAACGTRGDDGNGRRIVDEEATPNSICLDEGRCRGSHRSVGCLSRLPCPEGGCVRLARVADPEEGDGGSDRANVSCPVGSIGRVRIRS